AATMGACQENARRRTIAADGHHDARGARTCGACCKEDYARRIPLAALSWRMVEAPKCRFSGAMRGVDRPMARLRLTATACGMRLGAGGVFALVLVVCGCQRAPGPVEQTRSREIMGTFANLTVVADSRQVAAAALDAGYQRLDHVNRLMSDYIDDSEVGRLNALPPNTEMVVSPETFTCIQAALGVSEASEGAFDITCRPFVVLWKQCARAGRLPTAEEIHEAQQRVGWRFVRLNADSRSVSKAVADLQIDLGAIAKGYALDLAGAAMLAAGARGALVDVGGDVLALGRNAEGVPWRLGVRHPFADGIILRLALEDRAVATSGNQQRFYDIGGKRYSHIVDPRTGMPVEQAPSVTVIARDGMTADAWSTVLSVLSVEAGQALLASGDAPEIEALWIRGTREAPQLDFSPGFRQFVLE
ncbi:MAG: FAD:protein FMN transferase, partial [Planctomycetota bacterium]